MLKVSVCMITYNHERYIAQAIESALMQETDFDYEIVIGEDCSTDRTREIVVDYHDRFPDRIRLSLSETNIGAVPNFVRTLRACQGEYVAYLDGDDYWTDPHKLQFQVDFLDSHPECAICFHSAEVVDADGTSVRLAVPPGQKRIYYFEDLLQRQFIHHGTVMYRREYVGEFPEWIHHVLVPDWCYLVILAEHGHIGYLDAVMGVHRVHIGGMWAGQKRITQIAGHLAASEHINQYFDYRYAKTIQRGVVLSLEMLSECLVDELLGEPTIQAPCQAALRAIGEWSDKFSLPASLRAQVRSRLYQHLLFDCYRRRDWHALRYVLPRAIRYRPGLLQNRGVISIGIQTALGPHISAWLRSGRYPKRFPASE